MGRDLIMLLIGAVISLLTSVINNYFSDRKEQRKEALANKLELNHDLSKDIGTRYYLTYDILSRKITTDSSMNRDTGTLKQEQGDLMESRMVWNQNINSYRALLSYYYGPGTLSTFIDSIYMPFITLTRYAVDKKMYTNNAAMVNDCARLNENIQRFMKDIYERAYQ